MQTGDGARFSGGLLPVTSLLIPFSAVVLISNPSSALSTKTPQNPASLKFHEGKEHSLCLSGQDMSWLPAPSLSFYLL